MSSSIHQTHNQDSEYSIDELARVAGTTVRNVRAYQDRGILPPPERRGRNGIYNHTHLARLRIIGQLLSRGYSIANIGELIVAWEQGQDLSQLLGLESALTSPWSDETPQYYDALELLTLFGASVTQDEIIKAAELGIIEFIEEGSRVKVPSPRLLDAGLKLVSLGLPLHELLNIVGGLRGNVERVANMFVDVIARLIDTYGKENIPPSSATTRLADLIWQMRPLADIAIDAEVARAMEKAIAKYFGERLDAIMEHLKNKDGNV
ncbi:MAG TPA: MerR family transcriptional regulator [Agitococcus sp.]|jgi:DNA-binding transcriptional MerR regulator|uniref:MerR family transcriptional regulator n=1 Tax=uncultured Agitococcus sp. TaxID=1506599 RepID=UPI00260F8DFF|nr:MerR family transcriptional regulator [uncultured Agitococcus sp.]HNC85963.1 MerR family transcriptional regulator [Agitococcus sp.]HNI62097.1 MerR family transcriptional regulator [Agitococcus sp.]HNJ86214.1 MerR family transcriptional regulator [Agitococcus sp.]HNN27732.1 MerR family transcriptional regulator [Agitococcus sp.]HRH90535.1 MerR family transcriptional regulator [Agitococcus sp.]